MLKNKGFLMIEILILLVIFSIIGITLYEFSTKSSSSINNNQYRTVAISLANEAFEKMRANQSGLNNGLYLTYFNDAAIGTKVDNSCKEVNYNVIHAASACSYSKLAQDDLIELDRAVGDMLPQGKIFICKDSVKSLGNQTDPNCDDQGDDYVVKIFWKDATSKSINQNNGFSQVIVGGTI